MIIIAAVDRNWAIGKNNGLLVAIPEDQKLFRMETEGKTLIMGRKTFESLPGGMALPLRRTIVLTSKEDYDARGAEVAHSVEEVLDLISMTPTDQVVVAGGASIYRTFAEYCDEAHITKIDFEYDADIYMQNLDEDPEWSVTQVSDEKTYFNLIYEFVHYERKNAKKY